MPSRKKAKGQARKAAKVKNEEVAEKARKVKIIEEEEELFRVLEEAQIYRLQNSNEQSSVPPLCVHGFNHFPDDHVCVKFIRRFVRVFYKCIREYCSVKTDVERAVIESYLSSRDSTQHEYSEVWNNADNMKQVIKYFLYNGTVNILANGNGNLCGLHSASFARFFEQWLKVKVQRSQPSINWPKVIESSRCDKRTFVKFFWRRIRCSCLDERYAKVKSITKTGVCFNRYCARPKRTVERSELRCCSRCRSVTYCSRECQAADWSEHKELCDEVVATRAEFEASQKQQS
jgi:hypothetical protein